MTTQLTAELQLSFDPPALERCFLAADVLNDDFAAPYLEYALLGLSSQSDPFHVVATPLLTGQSVTSATVVQPGHQVLRMRREIEMLSQSMRQRLVPITFIHRHPSACDASATDDSFIRGVFINQVSTVVSFEEVRVVDPAEPQCECPEMRRRLREASSDGQGPLRLRTEYGVAFSLIVNRKREHRLYAVRKTICPFCGRHRVGSVPARLAQGLHRSISPFDRALLRRRLEREIRAKVAFKRGSDTTEEVE